MTDNILKYGYNKYTKHGNDGIIEYIFDKLNIKNGFFVEFGASEGSKAHCRKLSENNWNGLFIECDKVRYNKLRKQYKKNKNIYCLNKKIHIQGDNTFDKIINTYVNHSSIDFCVIDFDGTGEEIKIFETFKKHSPLCICILAGQVLHPYHKKIARHLKKQSSPQSLKVLIDIFAKKGYKLLCSHQDSFFIKEEFYDIFNVSSIIMELYLDGLIFNYHQCPYWKKILDKFGLRNSIINHILKKSNYSSYGWNKKRKWRIEKKDKILSIIKRMKK